MSFGRLTAAVLSGTIDTTVALASLNFDFSLVKVEAPSEYKELGISLSQQRSKEAENGIAHITARKLGALFADVAPKAPNLIKAYGLRASEIAKSPTFNPRGARNDGIFMDQIGADGTSIWAAATSGNAAISIHLLACMLARMWPGPEAVSIWVELVAERKRVLSQHLIDGDSLNMASITASEISLTRDQLARWDASARAWLLTADCAKELPQKQLMLILNNLGTRVDGKFAVYDSVLATWEIAMTVVDRLVSGMPQSIHTGAALLGLSAWHLYPDLLVLGQSTKVIAQRDRLIAFGGIATIGLEDKLSKGRGIHWSLPLAHLRFYGDPVSVTRVVGLQTAKLSIDQFLLVALGSFINTWMTSYTELETAAEVLILMSDLLAETAPADFNWLQVLADPARAFLSSQGDDRKQCLQLVKTGCRRYSSFFDNTDDQILPILELSDPEVFLSLCTGYEERIWLLRKAAKIFRNVSNFMIIRTKVQYKIYTESSVEIQDCFERTTVSPIPLQNRGPKRTSSSEQQQTQMGHTRWVVLPDHEGANERLLVLRSTGDDIISVNSECFVDGNGNFTWVDAPEYMIKREFEHMKAATNAVFIQVPSQIDFHLLLGDPEIVALYAVTPGRNNIKGKNFSLIDVKEALQRKSIPSESFRKHLLYGTAPEKINLTLDLIASHTRPESTTNKRPMTPQDEDNISQWSWSNELKTSTQPRMAFQSLRGLTSVLQVYKFMPESRLSIKVAQQPLYLANWFADCYRHTDCVEPYVMSRQETFACIAMFESGTLNLEPRTLNHVMAMSVGNSIYVAAPLLSDPFNSYRNSTVKRIIGNVGRPGIAMLIPPSNPKMRVLPHDSWQCVNHNQFDGVRENCFPDTTLHLTFSDWEMSIDTGNRGGRDSEVFFLEAPIALHDRGVWIADLDILGSISNPRLSVIQNYRSPPCREAHSEYNTDIDFASIDCWEELLERPLEEGIVRAHGNWQARLAAAALGVQRGHRTFVLSEDFCWNCYEVDDKEGHNVFSANSYAHSYARQSIEEDADEDAGPEHYGDDIADKDDDSSFDGIGTAVEEQIWRGEVTIPNVLYIM
ncbi:hypothetical protein EG329_005641 [Mollisiaceae sp. DMI_Dod_QoI]|nr:hypothetical protein EG329_005641 [Helotiales sp. DMI_Dod_QoI]